MDQRILIINTGGTFGMVQGEHGFVPAAGYLSKELKKIPELCLPDMPSFELIEYDPLVDSANMTPDLWTRLAKDIQQHYDDFKGFVILHGTDTMAYTTSALSFLLENLSKPVIFTGSQVPLSQVRTDARENIINALYLASHFDFNEVTLSFHDVLLRGNRCKKVSSTRYAAFDSPSFPPIATIETKIRFKPRLLRPKPVVGFSTRELKPANIATIKLFPGIRVENFLNLHNNSLDALVIGTYGMGNAPIKDRAMMDFFRQLVDSGVVLVNCTQCQHGRVDMSTYEVGKQLADLGFVSALDMTIEAVIAKLYYLLSCDLPLIDIKRKFQTDLRGELTV